MPLLITEISKSMIQITKSIEWDMGHRISKHQGKCRTPHGHRYRLELTISGPVEKDRESKTDGMILDFQKLKDALAKQILSPLDHAFMARDDDQLIKNLKNSTEEDLKIILVPFTPTAENIVKWCYEQLKDSFQGNPKLSRLRLYETPNSFADWLP